MSNICNPDKCNVCNECCKDYNKEKKCDECVKTKCNKKKSYIDRIFNIVGGSYIYYIILLIIVLYILYTNYNWLIKNSRLYSGLIIILFMYSISLIITTQMCRGSCGDDYSGMLSAFVNVYFNGILSIGLCIISLYYINTIYKKSKLFSMYILYNFIYSIYFIIFNIYFINGFITNDFNDT